MPAQSRSTVPSLAVRAHVSINVPLDSLEQYFADTVNWTRPKFESRSRVKYIPYIFDASRARNLSLKSKFINNSISRQKHWLQTSSSERRQGRIRQIERNRFRQQSDVTRHDSDCANPPPNWCIKYSVRLWIVYWVSCFPTYSIDLYLLLIAEWILPLLLVLQAPPWRRRDALVLLFCVNGVAAIINQAVTANADLRYAKLSMRTRTSSLPRLLD